MNGLLPGWEGRKQDATPDDADLPESRDRRNASIYLRIHEILDTAIQSGRLKPGVLLLEGHVAQLLGATRTPVRLALKILEDQGRVSRFDGRGQVVGPPGTEYRRVRLTTDMLGIAATPGAARKVFAWQDIYEDVERAIIHRSLLGRCRINELELARSHDVGRAVARDVLTRLESLGIVEKDDRMRWSAVPLDEARTRNLYAIRRLLEPAAVLSAAPALPQRELARMTDDLERSLASYPDIAPGTLDALETDLHVGLLSYSSNKEMLEALRRTRSVLLASKHVVGVALSLPASEPFLQEHLDVLGAVASGRIDAAADNLRKHIDLSLPKVLERMDAFRKVYVPEPLSYLG